MREMERAARARLKHALDLLDGHVASIRSHADADLPTSGVRQNLLTAAASVAEQLAIIDAFRYDAQEPGRPSAATTR